MFWLSPSLEIVASFYHFTNISKLPQNFSQSDSGKMISAQIVL